MSLFTYMGLAAVFPAVMWLLYDLLFGYGNWLLVHQDDTMSVLVRAPLWIAFCGAIAGLVFGAIVKRSSCDVG